MFGGFLGVIVAFAVIAAIVLIWWHYESKRREGNVRRYVESTTKEVTTL